MKKSIYISFIVILMLLVQTVQAQLTLRPGETNLEDKSTEFGKLKCTIIPSVKYTIDKPKRLELRFSVQWYKKGLQINEPENYLFLFDNFDTYETYFKNKGITTEYHPEAISIRKPEFNSIDIINNSNKISHIIFKSGFLKFNKNSGSPIIVENIAVKNALIKIKLNFVYAIDEGNKLIFRDIASNELTWTFLLPDLKGYVDCNALAKEYAFKLDKIASQNDLEAAKKLKEELKKNPDFNKCDEVKSGINNYIKFIIDSEEERIAEMERVLQAEKKAEEERKAEETRIALEKQKEEKKKIKKSANKKSVEVNKDESWKILSAKYEKELTNYEDKYYKIHTNSEIIRSKLLENVEENTIHIAELETIILNKDIQAPGSVESLKISYDLYNDINTRNKNAAKSHLLELRTFKSDLITKNQGCKSDFVKVDEKEGLNKSKKFREQFSSLENMTKNLEIEIENIQNSIEENENSILELLANFDLDGMLNVKKIKSRYDSLFTIYYNEILDLDEKFVSIRTEFENKRYGKWYFKSTRNKLLRRTDDLYHQLTVLRTEDSLIKKSKDEELALYDFDSDFENEQNFEKVIVNLKPGIQYLKKDIEEWPTRMFPIFYLILFVGIIAILLFGAMVYYKALKARKKKAKTTKPVTVSTESGEKTTSGGITITKTLSNHDIKGKGLSHVRAKSGIDYLELNLSLEWDNTTVKKVYFERNTIIKTYRFFEDSIREVDTDTTANETGGYLIGRWDKNEDEPDKYDISLEDFVEPGDDATFSRYQLNFGAKIGIKLQKVLENCSQKEGEDFIMTAWFHSHPGLKIFLSDYDLNVQKDFSRNDDNLKMIALVIDPYTEKWDTGIFAYKSSGEMNNSQDSKQFFSLDDMYRWALSPVNENSDSFYTASLQKSYPDSVVNNVQFSNPCILELKRFLEDNSSNYAENDLMVFVEGDKTTKGPGTFDIVLKNLHLPDTLNTAESSNENSIQSCIIKTSGNYASLAESLVKPEVDQQNISLVFAYDSDDNTIIAISKNKSGNYNIVPENVEKISLSDMISWTRKRK